MDATGTLQVQAWQDRVLSSVERVRPELRSIPVPIPQNPLRYVLVHALEVPAGVALVDAGWDTDDAWAARTGSTVPAMNRPTSPTCSSRTSQPDR